MGKSAKGLAFGVFVLRLFWAIFLMTKVPETIPFTPILIGLTVYGGLCML